MKKFSKLVAMAMAIFLIVSTIPPSTSFAATTYTTTDNLNVRPTPSTSKKAIGLLKKGSKLTVTGTSGSWLKIKYKNKTAYVSGKYVKKTVTSSPSSSFKNLNYQGYGANGVYIRATPNGKHLTTWSKNTPITVVGQIGNWLKIKYNNGYAYTYKTHVIQGKPPVAYKAYGKDNVYVRQTPNGKHLATWPIDSQFNVYAQNGNWMVIGYGNGYAYTYKTHVSKTSPIKRINFSGYGADGVYIRQTPNGKHLATWSKNTPIIVVGQVGNWLKIKYNNGYAYTYKTHVIQGKPSPLYRAYGKDNVYIRQTPGGKHLATWPEGTPFNVYAQNGNWMVIGYGNDYAYTYKTHVSKTSPIKRINFSGYGADGVYIRQTPNGKHLTTWAKNTPITVVGQVGNWLKIKYNNGYAYTYKTHVKKGNPPVAYKAYGKDYVYIRQTPNGKHLATWPEGTPFNVYAQNGNWMVINYGRGYAYTYKSHVTKNAPSEKVLYKGTTTANLNVRGTASGTATKLATLPKGTTVEVVRTGSWLKIKYKTGYAFVSGQYVKKQKLSAPAQPKKLTNYQAKTYNYSLDTVTKKQMGASPQTDKHYNMFISQGAFVSNGKLKISGSSGIVQSGTWNVRGGPSTNNWVVTQISNGKKVTIKKTVKSGKNTWYQIDFPTGWVNASPADVEYYLNPANFQAGSTQYYQFLKLSSATNLSTNEVNEKILKEKGVLAGKASSFIQASKEQGINELYLISHSLLETGNGTSSLAKGIIVNSVNGKSVTPKKVYNMYGIGAVDSNPKKYGAERAYREGWFTPEAAIVGGAKFISSSYINNGQDTLYKMRWNPAEPATHQYASDIGWAVKQTSQIKKLYDLLSSYTITYEIPKYQ
ncbi:SH3 domain-containing protein [Terrilactibacillus sp. BCM23-1]|uniref:SH3 domain-containing protein n=1 Tax=Terrilactibacillus tamarindi TaxID=2599694 RepID=A0A6N8CKV9_9BACI|nr:SH3 domain-containing protein [Terrilactibacillus tamarindi]MTT30432.1 SH3 domain-containing protein [Terrilactibacillus tamarindi]